MEVNRNVCLRRKATEAAITSTLVGVRRTPVPADVSLPRRRVSGSLSAANLAVDREELCIGIFVERHVRRRAERTGKQLDAFRKMQRPASPHWLIFRALGHRGLNPVMHTKELRLELKCNLSQNRRASELMYASVESEPRLLMSAMGRKRT